MASLLAAQLAELGAVALPVSGLRSSPGVLGEALPRPELVVVAVARRVRVGLAERAEARQTQVGVAAAALGLLLPMQGPQADHLAVHLAA